MRFRPILPAVLLLAVASAGGGFVPRPLAAQAKEEWRSWNQPVKPFRVMGNVYYVGANEVTSYLITSPGGHVLLDGGFAETAPQILQNIRALGFRPRDVKVLLNSHAHFDHAAGLAMLRDSTGARLIANPRDAALLARGGLGDFGLGDTGAFPPVKPDSLLRDGQVIRVGTAAIQAHFTPGHTQGCTTYTASAREGGRTYRLLFGCSYTTLDYRLVAPESYPGIAADFAGTFRTLRSLPCDVPLATHGSWFHLTEKIERMRIPGAANPFIDPAGCRAAINA
ncbi:MAG TPA: subclass B3 metallo-beta-lactamase, partial [Longimicrobiaceae bacterium]|nr:subclass B3 metallo-beta-lactamase [Longimicrobiaceae bacterium]